MGYMEGKVVLDTDVLVNFLRGDEKTVLCINSIKNDVQLCTTDINAFELYLGAYESIKHEKNIAIVKGLLNTLTIFSTNEDSMETVARILTDLKKKGRQIELRDLLIGSICLINSCSILTKNHKHFQNISGLKIETL